MSAAMPHPSPEDSPSGAPQPRTTHLEPFLAEALQDHPDASTNVFLMMRFDASPELREVDAAVRDALLERAMNPVRADDRDYTGNLWLNVEVCMLICRYGIAVFEEMDGRPLDCNVALELGYMTANGARSLVLRERRVQTLPAVLRHRVYQPFDMLNIGSTVKAQVLDWVDHDLHRSPDPPRQSRALR